MNDFTDCHETRLSGSHYGDEALGDFCDALNSSAMRCMAAASQVLGRSFLLVTKKTNSY